MKKPSDQFRIDETNELLGQVAGLRIPGIKRVGGDGKAQINPSALKVNETNAMIESITNGVIPAFSEASDLHAEGDGFDSHLGKDLVYANNDISSGMVAYINVLKSAKNDKAVVMFSKAREAFLGACEQIEAELKK